MGAYAQAERNERQAIEIVQAWYGRDVFEAAVYLEGLAETLICEHQYDEAARLMHEALKTVERDAGKDHPYVGLALNGLGIVALRGGNLDEAEADFRRMSEIYRAAFGERDRHAAGSLLRLGQVYAARHEDAHAEQTFRDAIQLFSQVLAPDNVQTGTARIELGNLLLRERRYREAETELLAGYRIVTPGRKPLLEAAVHARRDLIAVYQALNSPQDAARMRAEQEAAAREAGYPDVE